MLAAPGDGQVAPRGRSGGGTPVSLLTLAAALALPVTAFTGARRLRRRRARTQT
ncbi:hypothetical protein [Streptomyces sp. NPDC002044]|uniref:hypothetical protein n=1 Tax=Streptomyces sp. NPDC002044 TaxID=3154662 RepID=UPI00332042EF